MARFVLGLITGAILALPIAGIAASYRVSNNPMFGTTLHILDLAVGEQGALSCLGGRMSGPHLATDQGATYVCQKN